MATELTRALGHPGLSPVVTGQFRLGDVRHIVASATSAETDLGFRAEVPFAAGIREFARASLREPTG
jgi:dTDP-L-rhamnose 4-epimerase